MVESELLLTESDEEGWKAADKIWKDYMKKDVMVLEREIKEWKEKKEKAGGVWGGKRKEGKKWKGIERREKRMEKKEPQREREEQPHHVYRTREHRFALYGAGDHITMVSPISAFSGDGTWRLLINEPCKANISMHVMLILRCIPRRSLTLTQGKHGCIGMKFNPSVWSGPEFSSFLFFFV